jgi:hypothetical protein
MDADNLVLRLTPEQVGMVEAVLKSGETVDRELQWGNLDFPNDMRSLESVDNYLDFNSLKVLRELAEAVDRTDLVCLYEGCGFGTYAEELQRDATAVGLKLKFYKTDIYPKERYESIAGELNRNHEIILSRDVKIGLENYIQSTPEMLVEQFGLESVDFVMSCLSGIMYTPLPQIIGFSQICGILSSQGEAVIASQPAKGRDNAMRVHVMGPTDIEMYCREHKELYVSEEVQLLGSGGGICCGNGSVVRVRKNRTLGHTDRINYD